MKSVTIKIEGDRPYRDYAMNVIGACLSGPAAEGMGARVIATYDFDAGEITIPNAGELGHLRSADNSRF